MSATNSINVLKPSAMSEALSALTAGKLPVFIWGEPGIGKSQITAQVAASKNWELRDVRLTLLDPTDLRGLPTINGDGRAHWATPDFLPHEGSGVLFLDEMNAAPPLVQAAAYQLVLDRKLGEYEVPDGWTIVAAGNQETDRAVTNRMPTALANRFIHLKLLVDVNDWTRWAVGHNVRPETIAFIRFRPELLHQFDPKSGEKAFPTPRSWEYVSKTMDCNLGPDIEFQVYAGIVGQAAAAEYTGFLRVFRSMPSIDGILLNPDKTKVPNEPSALYAVASALSRRAKSDNFDRIWTYAQRMPAEFTVLVIADASRRDENLQNTRAFIEFGSKFSDVVL